MKKLAGIILLLFTVAMAAESIETLTFQGRLSQIGVGATNGVRDMKFMLATCDDPDVPPPNLAGFTDLAEITVSNVPIYNGIYSVSLPLDNDSEWTHHGPETTVREILRNYNNIYVKVSIQKEEGVPNDYDNLSPPVKVGASFFAAMARQVKWASAKENNDPEVNAGKEEKAIDFNSAAGGSETVIGIGTEPVDNTKLTIAAEGIINNTLVVDNLEIDGNRIALYNDAETVVDSTIHFLGHGVAIGDNSVPADTPVYDGTNAHFFVNGYAGAQRYYNAVWNDLAEFRPLAKGAKKIAGKVYVATKEGLVPASKRCQLGAIGVHSDTYGYALGKDNADTVAIGISGWVLAYVDKDYPLGTALVNDKNGNLTKASYWEKMRYPERIIGVLDMAPSADYNDLKIDGRQWVKIN